MRSPKYWMKDLALAGCHLLAQQRPICTILLYHSIGGRDGVSTPSFERQIAFLSEHFRLVTLRDLPGSFDDSVSLACLTFDDGHLDNYENALPVVERFGARGTFFLISSALEGGFRSGRVNGSYLSREQALELVSRGHEVGAHTMTHPELTSIPPEQARREISGGKRALEDALCSPVTSFAYPSGKYNSMVRSMVEEANFLAAVTVKEAHVDPNPDWLALPRVWVNSTMSMTQFRAKLSPGLELYEKLRSRQ